MTELLIFDRHDNLITIFSNNGELACPFWDAPFKEILNGGSTFEFKVPADHEDARHVIAENQVAFLDKDGQFRLFTIKEPEKMNDENGAIIYALCEPAMYELIDEIIKDMRPQNITLQIALQRALNGTRWQEGMAADFGLATTNFYYINAIQAINNIVEIWGGEIRDRIEISGNKIVGRYIDILPRRGADTGKLWEIDKDILSITHKVQSYPKTALYGRGSSLEIEVTGGFTRKISFADVEWSVANGDPVDKPLGQEWVGDPSALTVYGRKNNNGTLRHRFGIFESNEQKEPLALLQETWNALQKQKHPVENYSMDVFLLEEITGHEHEKVRLGDTTIAIDRSFAEPIEVEERVVVYEYDVADPDNTGHVELGQYIDIFGDDDRLNQIEAKLNDRSPIWDKSTEPVTDESFEDITPPPVTGFKATGVIKSIILEWDFISSVYIANYEVYASKLKGFAPDPSNLVFRGKTSGYNFKAETDEVWYFCIKAVNTHGRGGPYSAEITASTERVISDDILFGEDVAAELRKLSKTAELLSQESKDKIIQPIITQAQLDAQAKANAAQAEAIRQSAIDATNKVNGVKTTLEQSIAEKANAQWVEGQLQLKASQEELNNLKIGGRNLVIRLDELKNQWVDTSGGISPTGEIYHTAVMKNYISVSPGEQLTFLKSPSQLSSDGGFWRYAWYDKDLNYITRAANSSNNFVVTTPDKAILLRVSYPMDSYPLVARGNKATGWSPAPEDIFGEIDTKADSDNVYTIAQLDTKFDNVVGIQAYQTDQNGIVQRFASAESRIKQTEEGLSSTVNKTTYEQKVLELTTELGKKETPSGAQAKATAAETNAKNASEPTIIKQITAPTHLNGRLWLDTSKTPNILYRSTGSAWVKSTPTTATEVGAYTQSETDTKLNGKANTSAVTALETRMSSAETNLTQTNTDIGLKANKNEVYTRTETDGKISTVNSRIQNAEAAIGVNAEQIGLRVTKTEFDNLKIGGRNLVIRNNELKDRWIGTTGAIETYVDHAVMNEFISVVPSETLTFTKVHSKSPTGTGFWRWAWYDTNKKYISRVADANNQFLWTVPIGAYYLRVSYPLDSYPKIERGTKATDWTPAPEDVDNAISGVSGRLTTAEASITTMAGEIKSKASSSEVNGLSSRLVTAEQSINGLTGAIEQRVTKTEFNNIQIGGRNYVHGFSSWQRRFETHPTVIEIISERRLRTYYTSSGINGRYMFLIRGIEPNTEYTISANILKATNATFFIREKSSPDTTTNYNRLQGGNSTDISATEGKNRNTFTTLSSTVALLVELGPSGTNTDAFELIIEDIKLEKGNKATDWSPAPEDIDKSLSGIDTRLSSAEGSITTIAGEINSKASSSEVSGLSGRITTAEQSINGLTGEISNKVSQSDYTGNTVASLINQTATTIKLAAEKLELGDGDLVIENNIVKIKSAAIGTAAIANLAVTSAKIGTAAITTAKINDAAITKAKIADLAVDAAKIADAAIVDAKIANLSGTKIIANTIDVEKLKAGMLTGFTIQTDANANNPRIVMSKDRMVISNGVGEIQLNTSGSYSGPEITFKRNGLSNPVGHILSNSDDLLITQTGRSYNGKLALFGNKGVEFRNALILYKGYLDEAYMPYDTGTMFYDVETDQIRVRTPYGWKSIRLVND